MVHPAGFEPATFGSASQHSIQLSYGCLTDNLLYTNRAENYSKTWRGAGVVELDSLENCCAGNGTVGSNPTLSAMIS